MSIRARENLLSSVTAILKARYDRTQLAKEREASKKVWDTKIGEQEAIIRNNEDRLQDHPGNGLFIIHCKDANGIKRFFRIVIGDERPYKIVELTVIMEE